MVILSFILSVALIILAAIHLLWAFGYWFPIAEEEALVSAVVGTRGATRMPGPIPCALVTVALMFCAAAPWWPDGWFRTLVMAIAVVVFLVRGIAAYSKAWRRITPVEPFATLDRTRYGPLCLAIGTGFAILLIAPLLA
jgi:hypothetical protein